MKPTRIVKRFYEEVWNKRDMATAQEILAQDLQFRGSLGNEIVGLSGFLDYVDAVHSSLSDYRCEIDELIASCDRAFARMRFSGRHTGDFLGYAPTNKTLSWIGAAVFHLTNDRIQYVWVLGDLHGLHTQLLSDA